MQPNPPEHREHIRRETSVPRTLAGSRVDRAAAELFAEFSRAMLSDWIQQGALRVDGAVVKPKQRLLGGETLRLDAELVPREDWAAADPVVFRVVYQDEALLVVDKPPGVVVHPGAGNPRGTLVNGLIHEFPELAQLARAGIVHRLDKDTSGLLLVARTTQSRVRLSGMMARREISRRYLAVVEGVLGGDLDIDRPIGRHPRQRTRQAVRDDGRPARTRVQVLQRYRAHTLVAATLETGRTHQIRVHLSAAGHPLAGDVRYGARGRLPVAADDATIAVLRGFRRQALHAWKLAFSHPDSPQPDMAQQGSAISDESGRTVRVRAEPPTDLAELMAALEADAHAQA